MELNKIYITDALSGLKQLEDNSIDCIVTSPPYWSLRDYQTNPLIYGGVQNCKHDFDIKRYKNPKAPGSPSHAIVGSNIRRLTDFTITEGFCKKCGAWKGELGAEPTFELYLEHLFEIFTEAKRVLKKTGTLWVVLWDTYGGSYCGFGNKNLPKKYQAATKKPASADVYPKSLVGIPQRFSTMMIDSGWILRNTIIWQKPNATPESAKDRFTNDFEYLFFFTKSKKYYFDQQFEDFVSNDYDIKRMKEGRKEYEGKYKNHFNKKELKINTQKHSFISGYAKGRNMRTVWEVNTKPFKEAHFAVFPEELIEIPIKAGCKENGSVLDPFIGSGTTAVVSKRLKRNYIGFELNPEYVKIANNRLGKSGKQNLSGIRIDVLKLKLKRSKAKLKLLEL